MMGEGESLLPIFKDVLAIIVQYYDIINQWQHKMFGCVVTIGKRF